MRKPGLQNGAVGARRAAGADREAVSGPPGVSAPEVAPVPCRSADGAHGAVPVPRRSVGAVREVAPGRRPVAGLLSGITLATALFFASFAQGCGYRFAVGESGIPESVGAVYVPVFANRSTDSEAGAIFSGVLAETLARRGRLAGAASPARIDGEVISIVSEPAATGPDGRGVGVYRLRARVRLVLRDQGQTVCTREFAAGEDYLPAVDLLSLEASRRQAVRRLAQHMMSEAESSLCPAG